ncbi:hypothetical protein V2I01_24405 [Micromonospora sp. BRA006-A]|nr:hypothetical protein [Micromonospora sp. BRA006-A]
MVLVDGERFADVARQAGVPVDVPDPVRARTDGSTPMPALVSPAVAEELADAGLADARGERPAWLDVQGNRLPVRTAATVDGFSLVGEGVRRFVVLPWPALPADAPPSSRPPVSCSPGPVWTRARWTGWRGTGSGATCASAGSTPGTRPARRR